MVMIFGSKEMSPPISGREQSKLTRFQKTPVTDEKNAIIDLADHSR